MSSPKNRGIVYKGPEKMACEEIPYPQFDGVKLQLPPFETRKCHHGVIVKVIATNICGSDMHMYRGRTDIPPGLIFGHEITGEVFEVGRDVEYLQKGDLVTVPFNVACGRCKNCIERFTNACLHVNAQQPGGAYGYADMGGWPGGQAEYVMVPYADFQCLKIEKKDLGMRKILDIAMLSDILPTAFHGCVCAQVSTGKTVYIAGAGPVGICAAACAKALGASEIIVGDLHQDRLDLVARMGGIRTVLLDKKTSGDGLTLPGKLEALLGTKEVDCAVECVGFECNGHGRSRKQPDEIAAPLNDCISVLKATGGLGVMGVYLPADPGAKGEAAEGTLPILWGQLFVKGITIMQGQCPVMKYNRNLLDLIMSDRLTVAPYLNIKVIDLEQAPEAYKTFNEGEAIKYILDPHGMIRNFRTPAAQSK
jgi:glutathione-independent formaldehyde dehydrogenase